MAKTEEELIKMGFMQLKKHCKSLDIDVKLGATKGWMIKMTLAKAPPPIYTSNNKQNKEDQLKETFMDGTIYNDNDDEKKCMPSTSRINQG